MKIQKWLLLIPFALLASCNKPALYGTLQSGDPVIRTYEASPEESFRATKEALVQRGYSLKEVDDKKKTLETYWQATTADSHYVEVFGRRDYGTVGAYYRLLVQVEPRSGGSKVTMTNVAKSFISNLKSSSREEDALFSKIDDFTRKKDIEVTNIGLQ